jgi:hypothetical protein
MCPSYAARLAVPCQFAPPTRAAAAIASGERLDPVGHDHVVAHPGGVIAKRRHAAGEAEPRVAGDDGAECRKVAGEPQRAPVA